MLTFRFTGADGSMVKEETLTAGMVKKEVKLEFSSDWDNMTKTAVFSAGSMTRSVVGVSDVVVIPAEVLAKPLQELYVGVYGISGDGKVIPTIRVKGPKIKPGTEPSDNEGTDPELAIWAQLQQEIDKLKERDTEGKNVGYYIPAITQTDADMLIISFTSSIATMPSLEPVTIILPRGFDDNQNSNGLNSTTAALLMTILRNAIYSTNQTANITALENALATGGGSGGEEEPDTPVTPEKTLASISAVYSGGSVPVGTAVADLTGIVVTAHYSDGTSEPVTGYTLSGTISEGENVITVVYSGKATTFKVTGFVEDESALLYALPSATTFDGTASTVIDTGIQLCDEDKDITIVLTVAKEESQANLYAFSCCAGATGTDGYYSKSASTGSKYAPSMYAFAVGSGIGFSDSVPVGNDVKAVLVHEKGSGSFTAWQTTYQNSAFGVGKATKTFTFAAHTNNLILGARQWNGVNGFFTGTVKDFKVYNKVLTEDKINAYMGVE